MHSSWLGSFALKEHSLLALRFANSTLLPWGQRLWRLNPRLLKDKDATKDVAGFLISSLLSDQNLGGSEWDAVKAGVAECFSEWGKMWVREERTEIKVVSDVILLLSKPLSGGPGHQNYDGQQKMIRLRWEVASETLPVVSCPRLILKSTDVIHFVRFCVKAGFISAFLRGRSV
ncbi:hypothetical protein MRX96_000678 [Rhipicephalus microplus]